MALQSMTGFARSEGVSGRYRWAWELRSVNGKGLDLRLRLPPGLEALEADCRARLSSAFSRGNIQISLAISASEERVEAVVNEDALNALLALKQKLAGRVDDAPLKFDTLLMTRGVVDFREPEEEPEEVEARSAAILAGLDKAIEAMRTMREREGTALAAALNSQIDGIERMALVVEKDPSRTPEELSKKLRAQLQTLLGESVSLDSDRLYAEVAILATKSDLREEIDRLKVHVSAARELLEKGGPIGRKLDFLAQEFNRETNTICSKSNAIAVTNAGLEMKVIIDQFREQVQNLE